MLTDTALKHLKPMEKIYKVSDRDEVDILSGPIRRFRDTHDMTVLPVKHHMRLVMSVSDKVVAIDFGKKITEGTPSEVIRAYLGTGA